MTYVITKEGPTKPTPGQAGGSGTAPPALQVRSPPVAADAVLDSTTLYVSNVLDYSDTADELSR